MEKVYKVTFMEYNNVLRDTVANKDNTDYIHVGNEPFLVRESELDTYMDYGGGFRSMVFVGNIEK